MVKLDNGEVFLVEDGFKSTEKAQARLDVLKAVAHPSQYFFLAGEEKADKL